MGLEIIVRPSLPTAKRPIPQQVTTDNDNPYSMDGGTGNAIELSHSRSYSYSNQLNREVRRVYDVMRVTNPDDDQQYVDVEAVRGILFANGNGGTSKVKNSAAPEADNITKILSLQTRDS